MCNIENSDGFFLNQPGHHRKSQDKNNENDFPTPVCIL
jgi:hypothetical protein